VNSGPTDPLFNQVWVNNWETMASTSNTAAAVKVCVVLWRATSHYTFAVQYGAKDILEQKRYRCGALYEKIFLCCRTPMSSPNKD